MVNQDDKSPITRAQKRAREQEKSTIKMDIKKKKVNEEKRRIPLITVNPFPLANSVKDTNILFPEKDDNKEDTIKTEEESVEDGSETGSLDDFIVDDDDVSEETSSSEDEDETYQESEESETFPTKGALMIYGKKPIKRKNSLTDEENSKTENYNEEEYNYFETLTKDERSLILAKQDEVENYNKKDMPFRFELLLSNLSLSIKSNILEKINQLAEMQGHESDYFKLTKWVNSISKMPFSNYIKLPFNDNLSLTELLKDKEANQFLKNANSIMKKSTYGHEIAKDRIIQVITKWISNPQSKGNVIAFQGPPGIGKTSLARDGIAKAIGRPFCFLALGGATDASFLEGFSFTYEGSQWGRICQMLMDAKCMNPVIFMDELDKISQTDKGNDIAGLLTHITDGSQNEEFEDRYFAGVKIDLSKALFIFSYNDSSLINPILKDRITEIRLDGYKKEEKIIIAKNYSIPELMKTVGFNENDILFEDDIIDFIIENYTDEEGVRSLRRCIETILMKLNVYRFLKDDAEELNYQIENFEIPFTVDKKTVELLLPEMKDKSGKLSESAQSLYL